MATYKWANVYEWLEDHISEAVSNNDIAKLASVARALYEKTDSDAIQDIFQSDMDADGYFSDLDKSEEDE